MAGSGLFFILWAFSYSKFKKACLGGKEHFYLLILGSLPTGGFFVPSRVVKATKKSPDFWIKIQG
jgi:hypothetical protein